MTPTGAPTTSVSARRAATASWVRSTSAPARFTTARATAASSAALDDSPAPTGTSDPTTTSTPGTATPASDSAHRTPRTYAGQPCTDPGAISSTRMLAVPATSSDAHET